MAPAPTEVSVAPVWWSVFALGVACILTQLVVLREMLAIVHGNELVLGLILGNWFLLTGAGAAIGRWADRLNQPFRWLVGSQMAIALVPMLQVLVLRFLPGTVLLRGAVPGPMGSFLLSLLLLLPFCVVAGFCLVLTSRLLAGAGRRNGAGAVYLTDSLGSIAGGIGFATLLVGRLDHVSLLFVPALTNMLAAAVVSFRSHLPGFRPVTVAVLAGLALVWAMTDLDALSTAAQFPGQEVRLRRNSPYGRVVLTESEGQWNLNLNGVPLFGSDAPEQLEETVHFAMAQRPEAREVLLIGGGGSGTAREILKYPRARVTGIELDPTLIEVAERFFPQNLDDPRLRFVVADGRQFVRRASRVYDVVIVDIGSPATLQLNRFYSVEFLTEVKRILAPEGVVSFSAGRYENFLSDHLADLLSTAARTAEQCFTNVLMLPAGTVRMLASDGPLFPDIAPVLEGYRVMPRLLTRSYLHAMLSADRRADMNRARSRPTELNRDFSPVLQRLHLQHWLEQYDRRSGAIIGVAVLAIVLWLRFVHPVARTVFASGFAASAMEVVLLLGFQVLYGSLYQQMGMVITVFMAGLAAGAWVTLRHGVFTSRAILGRLALGVAVICVVIPPALRAMDQVGAVLRWGALGWIGIPVLTFLLATVVGMQFPMAAALEAGPAAKTAGRLYTADFLGAWLGACLTGAWIIPVLGLDVAGWIAAGLNGLAFLGLKLTTDES